MLKITFTGETRTQIEGEMRDWLDPSVPDSLFGKQPLPLDAAAPVAAAVPLPTAHAAAPVSSPVPPVPPSPAAASPSAPTATPPPAGSEAFDESGMPWDERIHSSSRALVADGTWRKKRGVDVTYCARIEAEIRAGLPIPLTVPTPPVPAAPASTGTTFAEAIRRIGPKLQNGTISQAQLAEVLAAHGGLTGLHELSSKPAALLDAVLAALGV